MKCDRIQWKSDTDSINRLPLFVSQWLLFFHCCCNFFSSLQPLSIIYEWTLFHSAFRKFIVMMIIKTMCSNSFFYYWCFFFQFHFQCNKLIRFLIDILIDVFKWDNHSFNSSPNPLNDIQICWSIKITKDGSGIKTGCTISMLKTSCNMDTMNTNESVHFFVNTLLIICNSTNITADASIMESLNLVLTDTNSCIYEINVEINTSSDLKMKVITYLIDCS